MSGLVEPFFFFRGDEPWKIDGNFGVICSKKSARFGLAIFIMTPVVFAMGKYEKNTNNCDQTTVTLLKLKGAKMVLGNDGPPKRLQNERLYLGFFQ